MPFLLTISIHRDNCYLPIIQKQTNKQNPRKTLGKHVGKKVDIFFFFNLVVLETVLLPDIVTTIFQISR